MSRRKADMYMELSLPGCWKDIIQWMFLRDLHLVSWLWMQYGGWARKNLGRLRRVR